MNEGVCVIMSNKQGQITLQLKGKVDQVAPELGMDSSRIVESFFYILL